MTQAKFDSLLSTETHGDRLRPTPFCALQDHTQSVTSIAVGAGSFPRTRVVTGSMDGSVKVRDESGVADLRRYGICPVQKALFC